MNIPHYFIADQVRHDRNRLTPATDHWIIALATRNHWRTPPCDRGKDRLRVLGRYVACTAAFGITPIPESPARLNLRSDPSSWALYKRLFPNHDEITAEWVHYRMNQIVAARVDLSSLGDDLRVRIPTAGSIHEIHDVNLRDEILSESKRILTDLVVHGPGHKNHCDDCGDSPCLEPRTA